MSIEAGAKRRALSIIAKREKENLSDKGIQLVDMDRLKESIGVNNMHESYQFYGEVQSLIENPKGNAYMQLQRWRKLGQQLVAHCIELGDTAMSYKKQLDRFYAASYDRSGQKWTEQEDNSLVELICNDDISLLELSTIYGRSPSAIQTRLSELVGIKRISSEVAGKFCGTLNGAKIEGNIRGTLRKGE